MQAPRNIFDWIELTSRLVVNLIILGFLGWFLVSLATCKGEGERNASDISISIPSDAAGQDALFAKAAVEAFKQQCVPLRRYWSDVGAVDTSLQEAYPYQQDGYGWQRVLYIEVTLRSPAESIPRQWRAHGHHCHYKIGVGNRAGMEVAKEPCQRLCEMSIDHNNNAFVDLPAIRAFPPGPLPEERYALKGTYGACLKKETLQQLIEAMDNNDGDAMKRLAQADCILDMPQGTNVDVIDGDWNFQKVRMHIGGELMELWTPNDNVVRVQ